MGSKTPLTPCCEAALAAWQPVTDCPDCGRDLRNEPTWADELNREIRRRPTSADREPEWADADDDYYGGWP